MILMLSQKLKKKTKQKTTRVVGHCGVISELYIWVFLSFRLDATTTSPVPCGL